MKFGSVNHVPRRMNYDNLDNALTFLRGIIRSNFETVGALWSGLSKLHLNNLTEKEAYLDCGHEPAR